MAFKDLTGMRFGRLTVQRRTENNKWGQAQWICLCDCGNETKVDAGSLTKGNTQSCGCLRKERARRNTAADLAGRRFGRLTAIERVNEKGERPKWLCRCDCGAEMVASSCDLLRGSVKSCGGLAREKTIERSETHGGSKTRLYQVWINMIRRCENKGRYAYKNYGARGISVCKEWKNFSTFREWALSTGYDETAAHGVCTLDRVDVNGDYCPENCRWVTMKAQCRNKRGNRIVEFNGVKKTVAEWSEITGIEYNTLLRRINAGWDVGRALVPPT